MLDWHSYKSWLGENWVKSPDGKAPRPNLWQHDSRKLQAGEWFFPFKGARLDGQDYINDALKAGALGFICDEQRYAKLGSDEQKKALVVKDVNTALLDIAKGWRKTLKGLKLVALTGSVGKTTTKEMIATILRQEAKTFATEANLNNHFGVPLSLLRLSEEDRFAVIEIGARKPGDIAELVPAVDPDLVLLLNAKGTHLEIFGTPERLLNAKLEIVRCARQDAMVVVPLDDPRIFDASVATGRKVSTFSNESDKADVLLSSSHFGDNLTMNVNLKIAGRVYPFHFTESHAAYPINWAAAVAVTLRLGISLEKITKASEVFRGAKRRYASYQLGEVLLIDDSYNANPDSMKAGLLTLVSQYPAKQKTLILGQMNELGSGSKAGHEMIGEFCYNTLKPEYLFTVGEQAKLIAIAAKKAGMPEEGMRHFADVDQLIKEAPLPTAGVVYTKASNAINLEKYVHYLLDLKQRK